MTAGSSERPLDERQTEALRAELKQRRAGLVQEIHAELLQSDDEHYVDLAERVHDVADESVADLLSDMELAVIDRHVQEVLEIERALQRIAMGSYGLCADCEGPIGYRRLQAYPTATRCRDCQEHYEQTHAGAPLPRL
ncbi:MAG: TraR/DksA family transcriptional regulator [Gammaproteobacteria bacterium]